MAWHTMSTMKPLKQIAINTKKLFAFDVETVQTPMDSDLKGNRFNWMKQDFLCGSVVGDTYTQFFTDKTAMVDCLLDDNRFRDAHVFATNLDFDFNILFRHSHRLAEFTRVIDRNGRFILCSHVKNTHKRLFIDTMNFTPISVKKMGMLIGLPKLEAPEWIGKAPQTEAEWAQLKAYNINDSMVTLKFSQFLQSFFTSMNCKMKGTLASSGIDYWRRNWQDKTLLQEPKQHIMQHYKGSIKGGRTEVIKRGYVEDAYYYDFNSMYPSCMKDGVDGHGSFPFPSSWRHVQQMTENELQYEGICEAALACPDVYLPYVGVHHHEKLYFPKGEFTSWLTTFEVRKALHEGYEIVRLGEGIIYTETFTPFSSCIDELYAMRQKFKREENTAMQLMVKTLMNGGLFGKFAQHIDKIQESIPIAKLTFDDLGYAYAEIGGKDVKLNEFLVRGDYAYVKKESPKIPFFIFPILSSYTTALARAKLYNSMKQVQENVLYADTDSIFTLRKCFADSEELGMLKMEHHIDKGIIVRPKCYYFEEDGASVSKIKGLPFSAALPYESFIDIVNGKATQYTKWTRTKESAVRRIEYGSIISMLKSITNEDDKRAWSSTFRYDVLQDSEALSFPLLS